MYFQCCMSNVHMYRSRMEYLHLKHHKLLFRWISSGLVQQKQGSLSYVYVKEEFVAFEVRFLHPWAVCVLLTCIFPMCILPRCICSWKPACMFNVVCRIFHVWLMSYVQYSCTKGAHDEQWNFHVCVMLYCEFDACDNNMPNVYASRKRMKRNAIPVQALPSTLYREFYMQFYRNKFLSPCTEFCIGPCAEICMVNRTLFLWNEVP